jgi:hypothetical protein
MSDYPEHDKLDRTMKLSEFTQILGGEVSSDNPDRKFYLCEMRPDECQWCDGLGISTRCNFTVSAQGDKCSIYRLEHQYKSHEFEEGPCLDCDGTGVSDSRFHYWPVPNLNDTLAELFGVDRQKLSEEKDQMLEEIRKANA